VFQVKEWSKILKAQHNIIYMKKIVIKKKNVLLSNFVLVGLLAFSFAEACDSPSNGIGSVLEWATCTIQASVIPLLMSLAVAGFIFGVVQFYLNPTNEEKRKQGKTFIVGGLIGLFVIISMWGLIGILSDTFELNNNAPNMPQLPL